MLCEKPMAITADECRRMIEASDKAKRVGAIAYCYRGYPLVRELRRLVRAGHFGALWRVSGLYLSQDVFDPEKYQWHFTAGLCGPSYALFDYGVHWLDLVQFISGQPITEIFANFNTRRPTRTWRGGPGQGPPPDGSSDPDGGVRVDFPLEDQADIIVGLAEGASGAATIMALSPGHPNHIAVSMDGAPAASTGCRNSRTASSSAGSARTHPRARSRPAAHRRSVDGDGAGRAPGGLSRRVPQRHRRIWRAMQESNRDFPTFAAGLRGIEIVEAAIGSVDTRRPASLSPAGFAEAYPAVG